MFLPAGIPGTDSGPGRSRAIGVHRSAFDKVLSISVGGGFLVPAYITEYTFDVPPVSGHNGSDYGRVEAYNIRTGQWDEIAYKTTNNGVTLSGKLPTGTYTQMRFYYYTNHDCQLRAGETAVSSRNTAVVLIGEVHHEIDGVLVRGRVVGIRRGPCGGGGIYGGGLKPITFAPANGMRLPIRLRITV